MEGNISPRQKTMIEVGDTDIYRGHRDSDQRTNTLTDNQSCDFTSVDQTMTNTQMQMANGGDSYFAEYERIAEQALLESKIYTFLGQIFTQALPMTILILFVSVSVSVGIMYGIYLTFPFALTYPAIIPMADFTFDFTEYATTKQVSDRTLSQMIPSIDRTDLARMNAYDIYRCKAKPAIMLTGENKPATTNVTLLDIFNTNDPTSTGYFSGGYPFPGNDISIFKPKTSHFLLLDSICSEFQNISECVTMQSIVANGANVFTKLPVCTSNTGCQLNLFTRQERNYSDYNLVLQNSYTFPILNESGCEYLFPGEPVDMRTNGPYWVLLKMRFSASILPNQSSLRFHYLNSGGVALLFFMSLLVLFVLVAPLTVYFMLSFRFKCSIIEKAVNEQRSRQDLNYQISRVKTMMT